MYLIKEEKFWKIFVVISKYTWSSDVPSCTTESEDNNLMVC